MSRGHIAKLNKYPNEKYFGILDCKLNYKGMCGLFTKKKEVISPVGVYLVDRKKLQAVATMPGNGSINSIATSTGYLLGELHIVLTFPPSKTECIVFKKRTKTPLIALARNASAPLCYKDIIREIELIDWEHEWDLLQYME